MPMLIMIILIMTLLVKILLIMTLLVKILLIMTILPLQLFNFIIFLIFFTGISKISYK